MPVLHAILLGIAQGLTEFLPVSSSGHLQIIPWLAGWNDFENRDDLKKAFDVALHLGTLVGLVVCLRRELWSLLRDGIGLMVRCLAPMTTEGKLGWRRAPVTTEGKLGWRRAPVTTEGKLGWLLVLATLPAVVGGVAVIDRADDQVWLTGIMLVGFGILLWWADRRSGRRVAGEAGVRDALLLGLAQACSLQPGVSRSGVIMTAGRLLDFDREAAARLAMLMSVPVIAGAGLYLFIDIGGWGGIPTDARAGFIWGMIASAVTGFGAVRGLLALVRTRSFAPFAMYRVMLGLLVLSLVATSIR
ncbi:undecaprenyl-diphosphate phosphatase [Candidatus Poriferisocius sp.]|uniref:undecaprenyl-diphosphate phosphatase n=1 Tax=Candidatus Poriferisocius sp. TaxID=3101276 RepID=UPI003B01E9B7